MSFINVRIDRFIQKQKQMERLLYIRVNKNSAQYLKNDYFKKVIEENIILEFESRGPTKASVCNFVENKCNLNQSSVLIR